MTAGIKFSYSKHWGWRSQSGLLSGNMQRLNTIIMDMIWIFSQKEGKQFTSFLFITEGSGCFTHNQEWYCLSPSTGKLIGHTLGFGGERELHPALSAIPETGMEPQSDATPTQSISTQTTDLGRYKHAQLHYKDIQLSILKAQTGSETEPNRKGSSSVLIIKLGVWAINI